MGVFTDIAHLIIPLTDLIQDQSKVLVNWVVPLIISGLTIKILRQGYDILNGAGGSNHLLDVMSKSMRATLVFAICLASSNYQDNVIGVIEDIKNSLISLFSSLPVPENPKEARYLSYEAVDAAVDEGIKAWKKINAWCLDHIMRLYWFGLDNTGIPVIIVNLFLIASLIVFGVIACIELIIVDFGLAIIFAIGPLFVACYAFESTAKFFDTWLSGVLKWCFTAVVIVICVTLSSGILTRLNKQINAQDSDMMMVCIAAICSVIIMCIMVQRGPGLATDMVGGIGIQSMAAAVSKVMASTAQTAISGVGMVSGGLKSAMSGGGGGGGGGSGEGKKPGLGAQAVQAAGSAAKGSAGAVARGAGGLMKGIGGGLGYVAGRTGAAKVARGIGNAASNAGKAVGNFGKATGNAIAGAYQGSPIDNIAKGTARGANYAKASVDNFSKTGRDAIMGRNSDETKATNSFRNAVALGEDKTKRHEKYTPYKKYKQDRANN